VNVLTLVRHSIPPTIERATFANMIDKSRFVANLAPAAMKIKRCGPV
jgi:hypothetical protein